MILGVIAAFIFGVIVGGVVTVLTEGGREWKSLK